MEKVQTESLVIEYDEEEEEEENQFDAWDDWHSGEEWEEEQEFICLFCNWKHKSIDTLFEHCKSVHLFDFHEVRRTLQLDFYSSFKLINYIRAQVSANMYWDFRNILPSCKDIRKKIPGEVRFKDDAFPWNDDMYLKPFKQDDALLYSFAEDMDDDDMSKNVRDEIMRELIDFDDLFNCNEDLIAISSNINDTNEETSLLIQTTNTHGAENFEENCVRESKGSCSLPWKQENTNISNSLTNIASREIENINQNYFNGYGSFDLHKVMLNDKVRMDAYMGALLKNPSLMNRASVMDVGCGTGILSLFAAQAGASRVIAVEASEKMATIATQIARCNGMLKGTSHEEDNKHLTAVIEVVQSMVEDLDKSIQISPHSIDVIVSEWMGYCLLYESMLNSVLYARDRWLKPGGAILPDRATIFAAGFGRGGTDISFWKNVCGFDMSCIAKEVLEDASEVPIIDFIDGCDIVTNSAVLKTFDLASMNHEDVDFTDTIELEPKIDLSNASSETKDGITWCHGIVLWFETSFTDRFCKEMPTVLSTSPYAPKTHWYQTVLTLKEPIAISQSNSSTDVTMPVGAESRPARKIVARISIVRGFEHRSIDISFEVTAMSFDGQKHRRAIQIFKL